MMAGCYTLDLYCDNSTGAHEWDDFPHTFHHEYGSRCRAQARAAGWIINRKEGTAICPLCSGKNKKVKKLPNPNNIVVR